MQKYVISCEIDVKRKQIIIIGIFDNYLIQITAFSKVPSECEAAAGSRDTTAMGSSILPGRMLRYDLLSSTLT